MIKTDLSYLGPVDIDRYIEKAQIAHNTLFKTSLPSNLNGFLAPNRGGEEELSSLLEAAAAIRGQSQVLVVVGVGGSYLGIRALIELLLGQEHNLSPGLQIFFAGNCLSERRLKGLLTRLEELDFSLCYISKSGSTTEPAVTFALLRELLEKKYGAKAAAERIYAITDERRGLLRSMADEKGYTSFVIPDTVCGRYSVLSPVGLLPAAAAGLDIRDLIAGAREQKDLLSRPSADNSAIAYAAARKALYEDSKKIELLCCHEPDFRFTGEWWKQLFAESEGKEGRGLFPAYLQYPADLHSMGQYVQSGERSIFETLVDFETTEDIQLLPYISGGENEVRTLGYVSKQTAMGVISAHSEGGVPNILIRAGKISEETAGGLLLFFMTACAISAYTLGVNPFDQPGVEMYKEHVRRKLSE